MESSSIRPAVDVAPERRHATLAFVLVLLSVPGSTMAWELPAGGFWIGMPLAATAIYLAVKARRAGEPRLGLANAAIVIAGAMVAMTVVWTLVAVVS